MNISELFRENRNIVINTDIDGILSALVLVKYCGCKIIGFTNSKDTVWLADGYDNLYGNVYVDMFVTNSNVKCIDQHVIAINDAHMKQIRKSNRVCSPQSEDERNLRTFSDWNFKNKYPFGTFQFLLAKLESEGIHIELPALDGKVQDSSIKIGDLLNRPDDAMKTTLYAYEDNAKNWWNWLESLAPKSCISELKRYLDQLCAESIKTVDAIPPTKGRKHTKKDYRDQKEKDVEEIKKNTKKYFTDNFECKTSDGGFNNITDEKGNLLDNILKYIKTISIIMGIKEIVIPEHYNIHKGTYCRTRWLDIFAPEFLNDYRIAGHQIFSYAFIYGPGSDSKTNFSFTIDMV